MSSRDASLPFYRLPVTFHLSSLLTPETRHRLIRQRQLERSQGQSEYSHETTTTASPLGHARALAVASNIVQHYRSTHRPDSLFITPDQLIETISAAGCQNWVLMGLYGYVGYLPEPRATQDIDLLIAHDEVETAINAILGRWPALEDERNPVVIRFRDPNEVGVDGEAKVVIDLMLPNDALYEAVIDRYHHVDEASGHRLPIIEAALAAKYSALVSPYRLFVRKQQDAVDFRRIVQANSQRVDRDIAHELAELIFPGGGDDILEFIDCSINDLPFEI